MTPNAAPFFLDSAFVIARASTRGQWHMVAMRWEARLTRERQRLVTTEFVLTGIADGLSTVQFRRRAVHFIELLQADPTVEIVPASADLFAVAFACYQARADQGWGPTDCSSFVVMQERGLIAALTTDVHFR